MKKSVKQVLSVVLSLLMIASILPLSVFAEDETEVYDFSIESQIGFYSPDEATFTNRVKKFALRTPTFNGCFGNQLSGETKRYYDGLVEFYVTDKETEYFYFTPSREYHCVLTYSKSQEDYIDYENLDPLHADVCSLVFDSCDALLKDYPELFWFRNSAFNYDFETVPNKEQLSDPKVDLVEVTAYVKDIEYKPTEIYTESHKDIPAFDLAVDSLVSTLEAHFETLGDEITREDMLKYMHDYICENSDYDEASLSDDSDLAAHSAQPFFIGDKLHVCEGYAKVLKILCDRLGIPCVLVSGNTKDKDYPDDRTKDGGHMWNYVQLEDGKWYLIDITWDDQDLGIYYTYFLANKNTEGFHFDTISDERYENPSFSRYTVNEETVNGREFVYPVFSSEAFPGHTHSWIDGDVIKAPTCSIKGEMLMTCDSDFCTATKTAETDVDKTAHTYTSAVTTPATHIKEGVETFTCGGCGDTYTKPVATLPGHTYTGTVTAPTCTKKGFTTYTCACGDSYVADEKPALGHNMQLDEEESYEPTCTSSGYELYVCERCGYKEDYYSFAVNHSYGKVVTAPTCTKEGYTTYTCSCGDSYVADKKSALGHNMSIFTETLAPTCTEKGSEIAECSRCDYSETREIPMIAHSYGKVVTAPTCTKEGYTTYTCSCGDSYVADKTSAVSHKDNNSDLLCDFGCGYEFEDLTPDEPEKPEDPIKNCSCNCHKGGISGFFFKIILFFQKLFRTNQICKCGVEHY